MQRTIALAALFLGALAAANLLTTELGPEASVYTALGLVALDLVLRDALHDRVGGSARLLLMAFLILAGGAIAYIVNADAGRIAVASALAFAAAMSTDAVIYHVCRRLAWLERSNLSNIAGAVVDSAIFVAVAFPGAFLWSIALSQTTAKIAGGLVFALAFDRAMVRRRALA
jgi:hypothetical protein